MSRLSEWQLLLASWLEQRYVLASPVLPTTDKATTSLHKSSAVSLVASDPASAHPPRSILRCFHLLTSGFRFFSSQV